MKSWIERILVALVVVSGSPAFADANGLAMADLKEELESLPSDMSDLIFGEGVAAVRWRETGAWRFFYGDSVQDLHDIAKNLNHPKIIVEQAKTSGELFNRITAPKGKPPEYKVITALNSKTKKEEEIARLVTSEQKRMASFIAGMKPEPKREIKPIEEDGPLAAEMNCLKALGDRNLQGDKEGKSFITSVDVMAQDGEPNGIYFFTPKGGKFVTLNNKKFSSCVKSADWGEIGPTESYKLQLKFAGRKPAYVGVNVGRWLAGVKSRVGYNEFPDEKTDIGQYCEVELKETLDDKMREVLHTKIREGVSELYDSYIRRLKTAQIVGSQIPARTPKEKAYQMNRFSLPNSENELDRLEVCKNVKDPKVQTAVYSEIGKFSEPKGSYWPTAPQMPVKPGKGKY